MLLQLFPLLMHSVGFAIVAMLLLSTRASKTHEQGGARLLGTAVSAIIGSNLNGIDQAIFSLTNVTDPEVFDILATSIVPEVEKLHVAGR